MVLFNHSGRCCGDIAIDGQGCWSVSGGWCAPGVEYAGMVNGVLEARLGSVERVESVELICAGFDYCRAGSRKCEEDFISDGITCRRVTPLTESLRDHISA